MKKVFSPFMKLATIGPVGYLPASGTWGSLCALPLIYLLFMCNVSSQTYAILAMIAVISALFIISKALESVDRADDPSEIILDEVVGCLITFIGIPLEHIPLMLLGFGLFRFFDITKYGIGSCELLFGAWGVVLDDVAAGIISNGILHIVVYWFGL